MASWALGVDPDLHTTGIAVVGLDGERLRIWGTTTARVDVRQWKDRQAIVPMIRQIRLEIPELLRQMLSLAVVEGQEHYAYKRAPPGDILALGQVAGGAVGLLCDLKIPVLLPQPKEWAGSVPKKVRHQRLLSKVEGFERVRNQHERDAVGLAVWGLQSRSKMSRVSVGSSERT